MNAGERRAHLTTDWKHYLAALLVGTTALAGTYAFGSALEPLQPIGSWLFWSLAKVWGGVLLFNAAATCFGHLLLVRVLRMRHLPRLESAVLSTCLGVFSFAAALFAAGVFGGFTASVAVALPGAMLLCGAGGWCRDLLAGGPPAPTLPASLIARLCAGAGVIAALLLYLQTFTPDAINYDASWMHVKFAEDYARHGRLVPFPGNYHGGLPHLASILYTYAYLLPGLQLAERWMLVLHLEFSLLLWTLAAVAATVQRMLGRFELRSSWAAFWLFPGIFVYDGNLGGAADHVLAFFSTCVVLSMLRVVRGFSLGSCVTLTVAAAAALLTKYQAVYVLLPVGVIVGLAWLRAWYRAPGPSYRRNLWRTPCVMIALGGALLAPHFVKNWIFYHNPLYPLMQQVFTHSTPSVPNGPLYVDNLYTDIAWIPQGGALDKLERALQLFPRFSFQPHYTFNGNLPVFGSLFTLLLPALLWLRPRRRLALVALVGSVALLLWGYTYNVDRNLQTFMPVLASVVGGILVEGWELGALARLGLIPLVGLQLVWGADAAIYSARERIAASFSLISSSFDRRAGQRFDGFRAGYRAIGAALPRRAKVLLHTSHVSLGIDRDIIQDWAGFQGQVWYGNVHTPAELFAYYRSLGVTHLLDEGEVRIAPSKQEDVLYQSFVHRYAKHPRQFGGYRLFTMPGAAPPAELPYQVLCVGLSNYADGLYPIERLDTMEYLPGYLQHFNPPATPLAGDNAQALLHSANAAICGPASCASLFASGAPKYQMLVSYPNQFSIYVPRP